MTGSLTESLVLRVLDQGEEIQRDVRDQGLLLRDHGHAINNHQGQLDGIPNLLDAQGAQLRQEMEVRNAEVLDVVNRLEQRVLALEGAPPVAAPGLLHRVGDGVAAVWAWFEGWSQTKVGMASLGAVATAAVLVVKGWAATHLPLAPEDEGGDDDAAPLVIEDEEGEPDGGRDERTRD